MLSYLRKNFPTVAAKVESNPRHPREDYKGSKFARKFPTRSGRYKRSP